MAPWAVAASQQQLCSAGSASRSLYPPAPDECITACWVEGHPGSPRGFVSGMCELDTEELDALILEACRGRVRVADMPSECRLSMYAQFCSQPTCYDMCPRSAQSRDWQNHLADVHKVDRAVVQHLVKDLQAVALAHWHTDLPEAEDAPSCEHCNMTPCGIEDHSAYTPVHEAAEDTKDHQQTEEQHTQWLQAPVSTSVPSTPQLICPWACGAAQLKPGVEFAAHILTHLDGVLVLAAMHDMLAARAMSEYACPFRHASGQPCKALTAQQAMNMEGPAWWDHINKHHLHDVFATSLHLFKRTEAHCNRLLEKSPQQRTVMKKITCPLPRCHSRSDNPARLLQHLIQHLRHPDAHPPMTQELLLCASSLTEAHAVAQAATHQPLKIHPDVLMQEMADQYGIKLNWKAAQQQKPAPASQCVEGCPFPSCCKVEKGRMPVTEAVGAQDMQQHVHTAHGTEALQAWNVLSRVACIAPHNGMLLCPIGEPVHDDSPKLDPEGVKAAAEHTPGHVTYHHNTKDLVTHLHTHHTTWLLVLAALAQGLVEQALPCPVCPCESKLQSLMTKETALLHLLQSHPSEMMQVVHCLQLGMGPAVRDAEQSGSRITTSAGKVESKASEPVQVACLLNHLKSDEAACHQTVQAVDTESVALAAMMHAARAHPVELFELFFSEATLPCCSETRQESTKDADVASSCHNLPQLAPTCCDVTSHAGCIHRVTPEELLRTCMLKYWAALKHNCTAPSEGSPTRTQLHPALLKLDASQMLVDSTSGRLRATVPPGALGEASRAVPSAIKQGMQAAMVRGTDLAARSIPT